MTPHGKRRESARRRSGEAITTGLARLNPDALRELLGLLEATGVDELELETGEHHLYLRRQVEANTAPPPLQPPVAVSEPVVVRAPAVGLFHRGTEEGAPPLVAEGDQVGPSQVLGIVEVLRMPHPVEAPVAGVVERFLVESGRPVEYGQPLVSLVATTPESAGPADPLAADGSAGRS